MTGAQARIRDSHVSREAVPADTAIATAATDLHRRPRNAYDFGVGAVSALMAMACQ
jgi:hypothetical protein